jgi:hypothetical protein
MKIFHNGIEQKRAYTAKNKSVHALLKTRIPVSRLGLARKPSETFL